jgi:hypothetical protein
MIHSRRLFLGKPWVRGCTHPTRELWTSIADEVSDKWHKFNDLMVTLGQYEVKYGSMPALDESSVVLTSLKASNLRCGSGIKFAH